MNFARLLSHDYLLPRMVSWVMAMVQTVILLIRKPTKAYLKLAKLILKVKPNYTMLSIYRIINLYEVVKSVNLRQIEGDIVQCGVWHGGSAAIMAVAHRDEECSKRRTIWLFDSFKGLPSPGDKDGQRIKKDYFEGLCKGDVNKVKEIFNRLDVSLENVKIVEGWFRETLDTPALEKIAVLHMDADWYDSIKIILDKLYHKVVPEGIIVLDDYWNPLHDGCRQALEDFFKEHSISGMMRRKVDWSAVYFQKPSSKNQTCDAMAAPL